jgi:hypothetical protein
VIHEALPDLSTSITRRIVGIGLIADPARIGTDGYNVGTASRAFNGIGIALGTYPAEPVPTGFQSVTCKVVDVERNASL